MTAAPSATVPALSRLYAARFTFALLWAVVVVASASELNPFVSTLLVLYPVYDIVGIAADARLAEGSRTRATLYVNIAVSAIAAIGLAIAATSGTPAVLRVFGTWAVVSGITQLVVGLARRSAGGQLPVILSGAISVLAGGSFIAMASKDDPSLKALAEYALLGGLFYLASSVLLRRRARAATATS